MKKIVYSLLIIISGLLISACNDDFLDVRPTDAVSSEIAMESTDNAWSILNGIYRLYNYRLETTSVAGSQGQVGIGAMYIQLEALGEDLVFPTTGNGWFISCYRWLDHRNEDDSDTRYPWHRHYRFIANANVLINGVQQVKGEQEDKDAIQGQAYALRAFSYYQLVQLYGQRYVNGINNTQLGVPLILNDDPEIYEGVARSTVEEVYEQIHADLDSAIVKLSDYSRINKTHINIDVARALKARVSLTQGNWADAVTYAQSARIDSYALMDSATYSRGFGILDNPEYMWVTEIKEDQSDDFGNFGAYMSRNFSSTNIRGCPKVINRLLYNQIPDRDVRKTLWDPTGQHVSLNLPTNFTKRNYSSQKFLAVSGSDSRVNMPHVRLAELYLIEAEALAHQGFDALAAQVLEDLVITRNRAYQLSTNTGQALLDEILLQRRIELWGEGFRFLDLKRLNLPLNRTGSNHSTSVTNNLLQVPAGDVRWQWLIPKDEINCNPNIVQNPL